MKILLIHDFYQQFGGEDAVAIAEHQLLRQHGQDVALYTRDNHEILSYGLGAKLGLAANTVISVRTIRDLGGIVRDHKPDVAFVHNIFPLISPSVYHILAWMGVPIVQVIHDFRLLCPNGWFYTRGHICEQCNKGNYFHAIRQKCHRQSVVSSTIYSVAVGLNRLFTLRHLIDGFICLTPFARDKLVSLDFPIHKLFVRPNFIDPPAVPSHKEPGKYVLYLGRLSTEKGLWTLVRAFGRLHSVSLKIAGTGPLLGALRDFCLHNALHNVEFVGFVEGMAKWELLNNSIFTIVPSEWYENFPVVILKAYASGKPVVGSNIGSLPYVIQNQKSGLLFEPGDLDDLVATVKDFVDHPSEIARMGQYARSLVDDLYSPEVCYRQLMSIFHSVINLRTATS